MAGDNLNQLGKYLRNYRDETEFVTRRIHENFPHVERLKDFINSAYSFVMEFEVPNIAWASIDLEFFENFETDPVVSFARIPLTITPTGLSIGKPGQTGTAGEWVAVGYLGDLNFEGVDLYSCIFTIETNGTYSLEFKIEFENGGVDLSDESSEDGAFAIVPLEKSNVIVPSKSVLRNVYIYTKATLVGGDSWVHFSSVEYFRDGANYEPREMDL